MRINVQLIGIKKDPMYCNKRTIIGFKILIKNDPSNSREVL